MCFNHNSNKKVRSAKFAHEPLCAFANNAMNIEFVYIILLGINNYMNTRIMKRADSLSKEVQVQAQTSTTLEIK